MTDPYHVSRVRTARKKLQDAIDEANKKVKSLEYDVRQKQRELKEAEQDLKFAEDELVHFESRHGEIT